MIGMNELHFNSATIVEAVQEYLDKRYVKSPGKVLSVKAIQDAGLQLFVVRIDGTGPKP